MELKLFKSDISVVQAGYDCPCGCTPSLSYARGGSVERDDCCCGNAFVVGPDATSEIGARPGYTVELREFVAPWNEQLEAAWLVGPSQHPASQNHDDDHHAHGEAVDASDPVCGMTVQIDRAVAAGLHTDHVGTDYYFCGRGCLLDFGEDPQRYLAPGYAPTM